MADKRIIAAILRGAVMAGVIAETGEKMWAQRPLPQAQNRPGNLSFIKR
jgi:hypothetical protein